MPQLSFTKAVASGNDFVIIDRFNYKKPLVRTQIARLARELCQRKLSIGADGLLLVEPSKDAHFKMRIFNPDGKEVDMCGNGSRCIALYAVKAGICRKKMTIQTRAGNLQVSLKGVKVKIKMTDPFDLRMRFNLDIDGQTENVNYLNSGVPHVVCFEQELDNANIEQLGKSLRYHPEFQPQGANANFIEVLDRGHIRIRTYERGVEQETLACGTGAVAASIVTAYQMQRPQGEHRVKVDTRGGERLIVYFKIKGNKVKEVFLEGRAKIVCQGSVTV